MIDSIKEALRVVLTEKRIEAALLEQARTELHRFHGSALSFFLSILKEKVPRLLIITPELDKASALASDLQQLDPETEPLLFPSTNKKPYNDQLVPDLSLMVQRSDVLERLEKSDRTLLFTSADALAEKLISAEDFRNRSIQIQQGDEIDPETLRADLTGQGYQSVRFVSLPGEFALRGGIFDVYPYSGDYPVRLEFFGNEVESMRQFDPDSQRSVAFLNETNFVPNATFENGLERESLLQFLPDETVLLLYQPDLILSRIEEIYSEAAEKYAEIDRNEAAPDALYLTPGEYEKDVRNRVLFAAGSFLESVAPFRQKIDLNASPHPVCNGSFKRLREVIDQYSAEDIHTWILCNNRNQQERFEELLEESSDTFRYSLKEAALHEGFLLKEMNVALLTDHQIFDRYHRPRLQQKKRVAGGISFKELRELNVGDYVVHVDYGIGRFSGFKQLKVRDNVQEAAVLTYQGDSTLYVNVSSLYKLQKYSGKEGTAPRVTRLGSGEWARKKSKTRAKVKEIARELIRLYAKRKTMNAYAFSRDISWQKEMEARFEFEETPDQMKAIEAVKQDMESENPMDRLICGDVGFGKTEVAIRAAFKSVMDQKQVAVLVPTTILADQHFQTFRKRMEGFPIEIEMLSRFRSPREQKKVLEKLQKGTVDILIGTHRIISKDVAFKDLGLMIVDEEQRFGVRVKEQLKTLRASLDVLTLTATPIPRTLQFSLMGARDLSIIHTAPPNRQPVYTEIHSFNQALIRDAIIQERSRGGQVFFIHNRIQNIEEVAEMIRSLAPGLRVQKAHGQMKSTDLEKIIHDFYSHKFDVLVSTNIVENGIDIANANTIFINNANHFGLSELHQLRGRVGRSNKKAFCYLLTPPVATLSSEARKRLTALEEFSDLGSGFNIAMRDLDIRGAGDILGAEQSGFINEIGFEMYTKILDDAVREIKNEEFSDLFEAEPEKIDYPDTQVEFDHSALLDHHYVEDNVERLNLYRKLSNAETDEQMNEWREEVEDRFGALPETAEHLLLAARIRLYASRLLLRKVTIRDGRVWLLAPKSEGVAGEQYYDSGLFQRTLVAIQKRSEDAYRLIQKRDSVRIVIHGLANLRETLDYLVGLHEELVSDQEVVA